MNIVANKIVTEGLTTYVKSNAFTGIVSILSYVENVSGQTINEFFTDKSFRYSKNGVTFSERAQAE